MKERVYTGRYPNIFLNPGDKTSPYRCPLCSSDDYDNHMTFVNEENTFAVHPPSNLSLNSNFLKYQIYITLMCASCGNRYHIRPRGQWTAAPIVTPFGDNKVRMTEKVSGLSVEIGKWQDYRIVELTPSKRYSTYKLNPSIIKTPVALLTGAGFSAPFGFPTMSELINTLPTGVMDILRNWLCPIHITPLEMMKDRYLRSINDAYLRKLSRDTGFKKNNSVQEMYNCMYERRKFYDSVFNDIEALMDLLFRIQRIAALEPNENAFADYLRCLWKHHETVSESLFVFQEKLTSRGWYPATSSTKIHPTRHETSNNPHFQIIRDIIMGTTIETLLSCFRPTEDGLKSGIDLYLPFLNTLFKINNGILPIFTTNYDLLIEDIYSATNKTNDLVTGAENVNSSGFSFKVQYKPNMKLETFQPQYPVKLVSHRPYLKTSNKEIALFRFHGCTNWFVDTKSENIIQFDPKEDIEYILPACWFSNGSLVSANIFPATVKDAYTLSPPFDIGYDYFSQVVINAKVLIIIGYSGRDETLKEILLWGAKKNEHIEFIIVGKGNKISAHLKDVLPKNRVHYLSDGICKQNDNVIKLCKSILEKG